MSTPPDMVHRRLRLRWLRVIAVHDRLRQGACGTCGPTTIADTARPQRRACCCRHCPTGRPATCAGSPPRTPWGLVARHSVMMALQHESQAPCSRYLPQRLCLCRPQPRLQTCPGLTAPLRACQHLAAHGSLFRIPLQCGAHPAVCYLPALLTQAAAARRRCQTPCLPCGHRRVPSSGSAPRAASATCSPSC